jgi:tetratricopeptide (TPR) repeat protein
MQMGIKKNFIFLLLINITIVLIFSFSYLNAKESEYFQKGKVLFEKGDLDKSKNLFEKDLVFNPKSEKSYLYLAKIFKEKKNEEEEELNLNSVLLLNPKNDEAIYMLIVLKIDQSDYQKSKDLIETFELVCKSFCSKSEAINKKFKTLLADNEKNKN